jgi:hypothetical protein
LVRDPDGSEALLSILAGQLRHYVEFARDYYEVEIAPTDVAAVYRHDPLTNALVRRLNPGVDLESLAADMNEIGYPRSANILSADRPAAGWTTASGSVTGSFFASLPGARKGEPRAEEPVSLI